MGSADWNVVSGSLDSAAVVRGVTGGFAPPPGGGRFVFGMASKTSEPGAVALHCNLTNFSPMAKGGLISAALIKRGGTGGTAHAPFIFIGAQGDDITDNGYLLGLSDDDPPHLILRKGPIVEGLPDVPVGSSGVLARSAAAFSIGAWVHVKLEMIANPSGDVVLNVYQNDLSANAVASPSWVPVDGMSDAPGGAAMTAFVDDLMGVNSGSLPYTDGHCGFGGRFSDSGRMVAFDHVQVERQL